MEQFEFKERSDLRGRVGEGEWVFIEKKMKMIMRMRMRESEEIEMKEDDDDDGASAIGVVVFCFSVLPPSQASHSSPLLHYRDPHRFRVHCFNNYSNKIYTRWWTTTRLSGLTTSTHFILLFYSPISLIIYYFQKLRSHL